MAPNHLAGQAQCLAELADTLGKLAASRWNTSTNSLPMIRRFFSGSSTPASAANISSAAST
jgi:hypothetical protein